MDYSLLESSQRLRADAARVIDHLEGGGCLEDDYVVRKVRRVNEGCMSMNANVGAQASRWLDAGKTVGLVGGDHSTPYGLIRALGARHAAFGILHVDAHCDLRDAYEGFEFSHASIMFNVLRDVPQVTKIAQVAVRDFSESEAALAASSGRIATFDDLSLAAALFRGETWDAQCRRIVDALPQGLREFRHRRLDLRKLPSHRNAGFRRPYVQPGRLAARYAHPLGTPYHRFRRGGGVPRARRADRRHHGRPHALETLRADPQVKRIIKRPIDATFSMYRWVRQRHMMGLRGRNFLEAPWAGGVVLLVCVIAAMLLANLPATKLYYHHLLETDLSLMVHSRTV